MPDTWLCPICNLKTFKFGTGCPDFQSEDRTCENEQYAHPTGQMYVRQKGQKTQTGKSIGISAISDEE